MAYSSNGNPQFNSELKSADLVDIHRLLLPAIVFLILSVYTTLQLVISEAIEALF